MSGNLVNTLKQRTYVFMKIFHTKIWLAFTIFLNEYVQTNREIFKDFGLINVLKVCSEANEKE